MSTNVNYIYDRTLSKMEYMSICRWLHGELGINDWSNATDSIVIKSIENYYPGGFEMFSLDVWSI